METQSALHPSERPRQLRLVAAAASHATAQPAPAELALAVWRLRRPAGNAAFPRQLARAAIRHYSDRGQLVLCRHGDLRAEAARHGRRTLPLPSAVHPAAASAGNAVVPLREPEAALVLAAVRADTDERLLARSSATLLPLLRPGGFLALAPAPRAPRGLGALVRACQQSGLQYWQHIVALAPTPTQRPERPGETGRLHRDLLVFRRPPRAAAAAGKAAVAA